MKRLWQKIPAFAVILLSVPAFAGRGVTAEDYFGFVFIADPHISPDGRQVAYTLTRIDTAANRRVSSIWAVPTNGSSEPRQLSAEGFSSTAPRWSPDGTRLAFLSNRNPSPAAGGATAAEAPRPQIWILRMDGGEAQQVSRLKNGASAMQWSPDGNRIVA